MVIWTDGVAAEQKTPLAEFKDVCVGWDGKKVLDHINWTLTAGEHWLIRGPNGAGKTTLLELITGDNMQVFSNEVYLFGNRRGSGETLWDLRKKLGIVSHRLHLEYRMVGGTPLEAVIVSGFHDSIGLYEAMSDAERIAAKKWLRLAGFDGREQEPFSALSYGEQRAAIILRAAVKCPPVLILDEPCHGLDEPSRRMILDLLETVAEQQTSTLLHVTHDPTEALPCERHIFEFYPGKTPMYVTYYT
jgi:molybdate transport system ATP-binding protein